MSTRTATLIRKLDDGEWNGQASAYRLSEPAEYSAASSRASRASTTVVVVSATVVPSYGGYGGYPETYIFPAVEHADGRVEVLSWLEMDGSYRGGLDHVKALQGLGYEVAQ